MALTLRVTSFHSQALGAQSSKTFGAAGGSIGRQQGNDWVLPDPERFVSSNHAVISCRGGVFYLRDCSTNGTFINGAAQPIGNGMEQALTDGDLVTIGEYQIQVALDRNDATGPTGFNLGGIAGSSPHATGRTGPTGPTAGRGFAPPEVGFGVPHGGPTTTDPLDFFADRSRPGVRPPPAQSDHASAMDHFYQPPPVERPPPPPPAAPAHGTGGGIPDDWNQTSFSQSGLSAPPPSPRSYAPAPSPPAHSPVAPPLGPAPQDSAGALAAVLMGAGLDAATAHAVATAPGLHAVLGSMLGVVVQGMLDVLKARAEIKSQFRVPVTTMRPIENNPLKFSANAAQALQNLLAGRNTAYLGPVEAFDEGFRDIKAHQIAMMAGMRAAFDSMLERFDPEELTERFQKRIKQSSIMGLAGKGRYWEMYSDFFEDLTQDADANFQRLFGDKFAQAYEEQMRRLTNIRR